MAGNLLDYVWKHCSSCSSCIICGNTTVLEDRLKFSPWIFSLLFFGNNSVHRIIVLVWMTGCMLEACGFDHMFSLLKRYKYSLYSDTMLHFGSTNPCRITRNVVSNETNEDVRMYTWRIYSSRCSHIAVQVGTELHWKCCSLYTIATIEEKGWDCSQMYNWHCRLNRITMKWEPVTYEN